MKFIKGFLPAMLAFAVLTANAAGTVTGTVTSTDGKPLKGVYVSDGLKIVKTDSKGKYKIKSDKKDGTVFVITPTGYVAPSKDGFQPGFWALLDKDNKKTETHDFVLQPENQDNFTVMFPTDIHIINESERDDLYTFENIMLPGIKRIAADYSKNGPMYAMNLGDTSHDVFWYANNMKLDKVIKYLAEKEFPAMVYSVPGNHDNDGAITGDNVDERAAWLYRQVLGPAQYSVNIGNTHWVMLDNILYRNDPPAKASEVGIKGNRKYDIGFTPEQIEWMKADIALVPDSMEIFIGCHAPLVFNRKHGTLLTDPAQLDQLNEIYNRFDKVTIVSGHAHRNLYQHKEKYPRFEQYVFLATSGCIWNTQPGCQVLGGDGSDGGIWLAQFGKDKTGNIEFRSYLPGNNMFRAYDLNEVGHYYKLDNVLAFQREYYPDRVNYADPEFTNKVMVNFWCDREGLTLEMLQNGKPLKVTKVDNLEDPLYNISYYAPAVLKERAYKKSHDNIGNAHMYIAQASDATSPVEVRVRDSKGNIVCSETVIRPKSFDRNAR